MEYVIGIDPDAEAHGVAIYKNGKLIDLNQWNLPEIITFLMQSHIKGNCFFSIEDAKAKKCVYRQHSSSKARAQGEIGRRLGMCQQAQIELERVLDSFNVPMMLHKPQAGNWSDTKLKKQFEKLTRWKGRSNADTRSAAFFGYLEINRSNRFQSRDLQPELQAEPSLSSLGGDAADSPHSAVESIGG